MNNDRFKFRVWNKNEKILHYDAEKTYDFMRGVPVICKDSFGELLNDDNYIVEQCTGLTDKNGKLIYEGDVLVVPNQYPYFDYANDVQHKSLNDTFGVIEHDAVPNYVGIVEWDEGSVQFVIVLQCVNPLKSGISDGCCHYFDEDENLEIIGDIHEMEVEK
jgi:uncharacterized phage protein (TIGR01671 family)